MFAVSITLGCCQPAIDQFDAHSIGIGEKDLGFKDSDIRYRELYIDRQYILVGSVGWTGDN